MIDAKQYRTLANRGDWEAAHALLDNARDAAVTPDDRSAEMYFRVNALKKQQRYAEALDLLQSKAQHYNSQCLAQHDRARILLRLGRDQDALDALDKAPIEAEMTSFPVLAMDAKFFHLYLLAKANDPSVADRLQEIPDDYLHVTMDGDLLTKLDIAMLLNAR